MDLMEVYSWTFKMSTNWIFVDKKVQKCTQRECFLLKIVFLHDCFLLQSDNTIDLEGLRSD